MRVRRRVVHHLGAKGLHNRFTGADNGHRLLVALVRVVDQDAHAKTGAADKDKRLGAENDRH